MGNFCCHSPTDKLAMIQLLLLESGFLNVYCWEHWGLLIAGVGRSIITGLTTAYAYAILVVVFLIGE